MSGADLGRIKTFIVAGGVRGIPVASVAATDMAVANEANVSAAAQKYYYCGGNFYRAVFQGNTLVYVTAKPE